ncbi:hypothetical protein CPHO_03345 [Corynebacterium phocae]|uniref:Helix-hairpin-helix DNA-binding motif class 1 domain-containing protein n=1 Tax=Corynebacterium phocae TaxID=161895 RepID=A0A1L7D1Q0_9CORY|nr:ComEA family DNA-binding protein [Corynebacterium phocae]APT92086.1 hypothetical protein CPHO_03345 [Corynebacterium phocae]KAA8726470.1 helix-hairpin-helix domain-containing protein [Corynebacterium phocae]
MARNKNARSGAGRLQDLLQPTGEEALLNVEYPRPRFGVPVRQAVVVAAVLVAVAVLYLLSAPRVVEPTSAVPGGVVGVTAATGAPLQAPVGAGAGEPSELVVSVVGNVEVPGLVTLAPGARVADALAHARPLPDANLTDVNHAARLSDGQQINVRPQGQPQPPEPGGQTAGKVSLNTANAAQLTQISGVGEVTAAAIVAHRERIGAFSDIAQLQDINGIGPAKFTQISAQVTL